MSRLSKGLRNVSSKVLGKFGGDVTIQKITPGSYREDVGEIVESITQVTVKGLLQNVNQRETNSLIKDNDKICLIAASDLDFIPSTSDRVLIANIDYQIVRVFIDENDNSQIKYELYLRA